MLRVDEALFTKTRTAVLALFLLNPKHRFYIREVVRRLGAGNGPVQKELGRLRRAGVLVAQREGRRLYFQANPQSFTFDQLRELIDRSVGPVGRLREVLLPLEDEILVAFIYGSVASDSATPDSDLDLMVVGRLGFDDLFKFVRPLQEVLGREINPSVFTRREFLAKLEAKTHFLENVMAGPKKFVIGELSDLGPLA